MPHILQIPLIARGDPPRDVYRALHANLMQWLHAVDPATAAEVHDRPARKPFTLSALSRADAGGWTWRMTLLQDALLSRLLDVARAEASLNLNGTETPVRWPATQVWSRSYDELATEAHDETYLRLAFVSPTTFRQGRLDLPLPEPGAVVQSWLSRWNDFAPPHRRMATEVLDVVRSQVAIADIEGLHTERHDLGRSNPVGFVGRVTFFITQARRLNQADVGRINALADYAEFCGTGRKTTQGMGQTRRVR